MLRVKKNALYIFFLFLVYESRLNRVDEGFWELDLSYWKSNDDNCLIAFYLSVPVFVSNCV